MKKRPVGLYVALSAPLLLIVFLVAFVIFNTITFSPSYDFMYYDGYEIQLGSEILVSEGRLVISESYTERWRQGAVNQTFVEEQLNNNLYRYHVDSGESVRVSFEESQTVSLIDSRESPDGYRVEQRSSYSLMDSLFGGSRNSGVYILSGGHQQRIIDDQTWNFQFIAWVDEQ